MKIAMWSGPRNLSTAMMYSFGNRVDFVAMDEPFYGAYLDQSGIRHPLHDEVLAAHETDPDKVAEACAVEPAQHAYMKHMPHQMLDHFPLGWAKDCVNIHLIRHPARVLASYSQKRRDITLADIGFAQQLKIYEKVGGLVIDSADIRRDPRRALSALCAKIGLDFDEDMLTWPAGPKPFDGIWASHWYGAVHKSTGFSATPDGPLPELPDNLTPLLEQAMPYYTTLADRVTRLLAD